MAWPRWQLVAKPLPDGRGFHEKAGLSQGNNLSLGGGLELCFG